MTRSSAGVATSTGLGIKANEKQGTIAKIEFIEIGCLRQWVVFRSLTSSGDHLLCFIQRTKAKPRSTNVWRRAISIVVFAIEKFLSEEMSWQWLSNLWLRSSSMACPTTTFFCNRWAPLHQRPEHWAACIGDRLFAEFLPRGLNAGPGRGCRGGCRLGTDRPIWIRKRNPVSALSKMLQAIAVSVHSPSQVFSVLLAFSAS